MLICMTPHLYQSPFRLLRDPDPRANHLTDYIGSTDDNNLI